MKSNNTTYVSCLCISERDCVLSVFLRDMRPNSKHVSYLAASDVGTYVELAYVVLQNDFFGCTFLIGVKREGV
jgi:hypothetical protein